MPDTPHLALPLLAAAQAQKHVTHNEALALLDALVQLSVKERGRAAPPADPAEGERWLVGAGVGAFAGRDGMVALFDAGAWRFLAPRPGWRLYLEAEDALLLFDGADWRPLGGGLAEEVARLGVGTAADVDNPLSAKLNAALFTARSVGEGGSGDLRFTLNKEGSARVLSQLYQSGYAGRAETGLVGDDDYRIRVSADGALWRDALVVERATGQVRFPAAAPAVGGAFRNLLVNPAFTVNQRGFAGGALAADAFGFDRWRAGAGGCTVSAIPGGATLTGTLRQVIESPGLAGQVVTVSMEDPDGPVDVSLGEGATVATGTIQAGGGRRALTLAVPGAATGNLELRLTAAAPTILRRVQLEAGTVATAFETRPISLETLLCRRFYLPVIAGAGSFAAAPLTGFRVNAVFDLPVIMPVPMRATPAVRHSAPAFTVGSPAGNAIAVYDAAAAGWHGGTGTPAFSLAGAPTGQGAALRITLATASGTAGGQSQLWCGPNAFIALDAEL